LHDFEEVISTPTYRIFSQLHHGWIFPLEAVI